MATAADIGANFSSYEGNAALGGAAPEVLKIDTKPFEDLARYTMLYNKAQYDQRQKDADEMITELAKNATINVNDLYGKDKTELNSRLLEFTKKVSEIMRTVPKSPGDKLKKASEYYDLKRGITSDYESGKKRSVKMLGEMDKIKEMKIDAGVKEAMLKQLEEKFNSSKISEQISSVDTFDLKKPEFKPAIASSYVAIGKGGNENFKAEYTIFNPKVNALDVNSTLTELHDLYPVKDSDAWNELTPGQKTQAEQQSGVGSSAKAWMGMTDEFNIAIKKHTVNGVFDEAGFKSEYSGIPMINDVYESLKDLKDYSVKKKAEAAVNIFDDKGFKWATPKSIDPNDFNSGIVDFNKGVTAQQLGLGYKFKGWTDKVEKSVQLTDNAIQWDRFKLEEKAFNDKAKGPEESKNAALTFAKNLMADIASKASYGDDKASILTPDDLRKLGQDQLKYLGVEVPPKRDEDRDSPTFGKIIEQGGLQPLSLGKNDLIELRADGTVMVMKNAKFDPKSRRFIGLWDNARSTSIWNAATNRLNEENIKSGSNERTAYNPIDMRGTEGVIQIDQKGATEQHKGSWKSRATKQ